MKLFHFIGLGIAGVTLTASAASAAVLFQDNFESPEGTATAFPNGDFGPYPSAQVGTWTNIDGVSPSIQVTKGYAPVEGQQALALRRSVGDNYGAIADFSAPATGTATELVHISFKYIDPTPDINASGPQDRVVITAQDKVGNGWGSDLFGLNIIKWDDTVWLQVGGVGVGWAVNPSTSWQQVDVWADLENSRLTFALNGVVLAGSTDIPFNGTAPNLTQIQQLIFSAYSGGSQYAIDDLRVEVVPEPAAASLLLIGGTALLGRRRSTSAR